MASHALSLNTTKLMMAMTVESNAHSAINVSLSIETIRKSVLGKLVRYGNTESI